MSRALKTDLYQVIMLAAQYYKGLNKQIITCEAFARTLPASRKFLVMAGTENIRDFLINLSFTKDDISYLKENKYLKDIFNSSNFEEYLLNLKFTGDLWAMAEGEIVFAGEPLVRVTAPLPQVHLVETYILSVLNHDIKVASKAARIVLAARGKPVIEFATRRTHHEAAIDASRAAYLAGFTATSNLEAGKRFDIPVAGTMSHMWVMTHDDEQQAFKNFKDVYRSPILLVDTYDTLEGVRKSLNVPLLYGIRLDSGDLDYLSREARKILDGAGKQSVKIIASGDLDEYKIDTLEKNRAPIDIYAVGTELVVSRDAPSLGIVYKAVYDDSNHRPLIKKSVDKQTLPGRKQVYLDQRNGGWSHLVALEGSIIKNPELSPLLDCHVYNGVICNDPIIDLKTARQYCNGAMVNLHADLSRLDYNENYPLALVPVYPHNSLIKLFQEASDGLDLE